MAVVRTDLRKAPERKWTPPQESRDGRVSSIAQLTAAKVSNPKFRGKVRKFSRHFKGHFSIGNVQVRILRGQPGSAALGESAPDIAERPANGGLLRISHQSPGSGFGHSQQERADSLWRTFEKLPFFGRLRPETGLDLHCLTYLAVKTRQNLHLGRRQNGNAEPALPRRARSATTARFSAFLLSN
jgi:hypothetical protein